MTITKEEYLRLKIVDAKMDLLEAGGVDNWQWYGASLHQNDDPEQNLDAIKEKLRKEIMEGPE